MSKVQTPLFLNLLMTLMLSFSYYISSKSTPIRYLRGISNQPFSIFCWQSSWKRSKSSKPNHLRYVRGPFNDPFSTFCWLSCSPSSTLKVANKQLFVIPKVRLIIALQSSTVTFDLLSALSQKVAPQPIFVRSYDLLISPTQLSTDPSALLILLSKYQMNPIRNLRDSYYQPSSTFC